MGNIKDYIDWRGDIPLTKSYFNEVDNLIFAELSYINFQKIIDNQKMTIKNAIEKYLNSHTEKEIENELVLSQNPLPFLIALKDSKRFGDLKIINYANIASKKEEKQFSALTIELNYNTIYVAFEGTDNTLFGWKEDLNLSFMSEIPSQLEAVNYVNNISRKYKNILLGGHSKGGNLAIYAGVHCKKRIKKRIKRIYNNDGPGFLEEFTNLKEYNDILKKIVTIVPETSIIGMLLTKKEEYKVIKSSGCGIWQHDALSWQVVGDHFITVQKTDETSVKINEMLNDWLSKISKKEREQFINSLFSILDKNKIETIEDLAKLSIRKIPGLVKSYKKLEEESRKLMLNLLGDLVREAKKSFNTKTLIKGIREIGKKS